MLSRIYNLVFSSDAGNQKSENIIYNYLLSNFTWIKKISLTNNIMTVYGHDDSLNIKSNTIIGFITDYFSRLNQESCGQFAREIKDGNLLHDLLHHNDSHLNLAHVHSPMCELITPKKLTSVVSDILKLQNNQTEKMDYIQYMSDKTNRINDILSKNNKPGLIPPDARINLQDLNKMEFISRADAKQLITDYKDFYATHEKEIVRQYHGYRKQFTLKDEGIELGQCLLYAFIHTVILSVLEENLIKHAGVSRKNAHLITGALQLILLALIAPSMDFVIASCLLMFAFDQLKTREFATYAIPAFAVLTVFAARGSETSMELLKGITYAGGMKAASFAARKMAQVFYTPAKKQKYLGENVVYIEDSELRKPGMH